VDLPTGDTGEGVAIGLLQEIEDSDSDCEWTCTKCPSWIQRCR